MDAASLLHFLRGRSRTFVAVGIVVAFLAALYLLGYAVFAAGLMSGPTPDGELLAPFRWWAYDKLA
jgi:hypothetical protein